LKQDEDGQSQNKTGSKQDEPPNADYAMQNDKSAKQEMESKSRKKAKATGHKNRKHISFLPIVVGPRR
jgi:hypothetical protein